MFKKRNSSLGAVERHKISKQARRPRKRSLWERVKLFFASLKWWWQGGLLSVKLERDAPTRTEAQIALDRVVLETHLPHDCITATIVRGGPCIYVKHDGPHEAFIAHTYKEAADRAIEWINAQGEELTVANTTKLSRKAQKEFDAWRRKLATKVRLAKRQKGGMH